jgi:galacturan 1,4-alpha-galacturonidase
MRTSSFLAIALGASQLALASPLEATDITIRSSASSKRPNHSIRPYHPGKPFPPSPPRSKTCTVKTYDNDGKDDSKYILKAIKECNNGGHVVFERGKTYTIGTALNLTFLKNIDLDVQGTIKFTNDTDYWQANAFRQVFQNATTFFQLGGHDVSQATS